MIDFKRGFYADAVRDFSRAINSAPTGDAYYQRGMSYRQLGNEVQAQADFDKAKQLGYKP